MPFEIIRNDITKMKVDAIVNAANNKLKCGGGVCGSIFHAAGSRDLKKGCKEIGECQTGQAVITSGYKLPAKFIIHTAGPIWRGGESGEKDSLYSCYKNSLELAKANNLESIAFPLISSGVYKYPRDLALEVARSAIRDFLLENDMSVFLVVFDKKSFSLSEKLYSDIKTFIDDNYADMQINSTQLSANYRLREKRTQSLEDNSESSFSLPPLKAPRFSSSLNNMLSRLEETFSQRLLRFIDEKNRIDADVYKRANIDRRVFSKIRSNKDYKPSKNTAIALAIALELPLDDTRDLLMSAGFALSRSNVQDVIVEYFIGKGNYNIFEINEALFAFDQSLLGA